MTDLLETLAPRLLALPVSGEHYYSLRLLGRADGIVEQTTQTEWVGFDKADTRREVRVARVMNAEEASAYRASLARIGEDCILVRTSEDLGIFYLSGGNALLKREIAESQEDLRQLLGRQVLVREGRLGFVSASSLPAAAFNRATGPKVRMTVLKRDGYRCRICGRRAADHLDVELHVHHIRPWGQGGITTARNLVTLCHTCHAGLEPHGDWSLFDLVDPASSTRENVNEEYRQGLEWYWRIAVNTVERMRVSNAHSSGQRPQRRRDCASSIVSR